ncbi:MAG TPA: aminotransferase DegT [Chloroflexi bacterium]|jgi:dTDP-4-amino-4,6-dideoxygalactose transaminase|nr:aminotransferase DegT [Chloroflexota bacterium]HAF20928.1 aminotransferase DegT [Chloroflexota bacterium]
MKQARPVASEPRLEIAHPLIGEEEKRAVLAVLESGQLAQGPVVAAFEDAFARWLGVKHAVAVASGTAGLHLALLAHGIGEGDEVVTAPFTFIASANSVLFARATPVFADVQAGNFCIDPARVEVAITPRTRAILPVHLYGHPAPMAELGEIARRHGLLLIEDACQAHGATVHGRKVGALGHTAVFSLYPTKNMTSGEGGFVTTDDPAIASAIRTLRQHGEGERYHHEVLGYNFRMTDVAAAIGLAQLARLDGFNAARRHHAQILSAGLAGAAGLAVPGESSSYGHVYHQYTVRVEAGRDGLRKRLDARGIGTGVYYPIPIHHQPVYVERGYGGQSFPTAERLAQEVLSLPVHPALSDADLQRIVRSVREELAG